MVHETTDYICSEFADMVNEQVESINNALGEVVVEVENSEELDGGINIYIGGKPHYYPATGDETSAFLDGMLVALKQKLN